MRDYKRDELYPASKILSSTQILDYGKDPRTFYERWAEPRMENGVMIFGTPMKESPALIFGQVFSEAYADRDFDYRTYLTERKINKRWIQVMETVLPKFPVLPKKDCEYELRVKYKGWTIRITLDGIMREQGIVIENKTGQGVWNQWVCDNHPQITLQQWGYWRKTKMLPVKHIVNWVDTAPNSRQLINTFTTVRTVEQLEAFQEKIDKILSGLEVGHFGERLVTL